MRADYKKYLDQMLHVLLYGYWKYSQSPVISLAGPQPGRLLKMAASFSPEHTEADDQLVRCYDILKAIHAKVMYLLPTRLPLLVISTYMVSVKGVCRVSACCFCCPE